MRHILAATALALGTTAVSADCPTKPPILIEAQKADQIVSANWLMDKLSGKKLKYSQGGVEHYKSDGSYSFIFKGKDYDAPTYRFYDGGMRCIGYSEPRFDRYVMSKGKLIFISAQGERSKARIK